MPPPANARPLFDALQQPTHACRPVSGRLARPAPPRLAIPAPPRRPPLLCLCIPAPLLATQRRAAHTQPRLALPRAPPSHPRLDHPTTGRLYWAPQGVWLQTHSNAHRNMQPWRLVSAACSTRSTPSIPPTTDGPTSPSLCFDSPHIPQPGRPRPTQKSQRPTVAAKKSPHFSLLRC